ncbi:MAG: ATP-binding/permease protein CydC [Frankiales bacterium]|nr:ATP-binding/permease protein CydC [Frankiales bacterium]
MTGFGLRGWTDDDLPPDGVNSDSSPAADVVMSDISAGYGDRLVIDRAWLEIPAGTFAVLAGPSGAGKSTLLAVMAGEFPGVTGQVRIGGLDPAAISYAERVANITLIEQDSSILSGTVADNLRLARPSASARELADALRVVDLDKAIELSTAVGPGGAYLSGGQRRRLALAQGYLRRPRLLLLDEPTEGLDTATARRVLTNLRSALSQTTIVAAIHDRNQANLSSSLGPVIRLDGGRVASSDGTTAAQPAAAEFLLAGGAKAR